MNKEILSEEFLIDGLWRYLLLGDDFYEFEILGYILFYLNFLMFDG